MKSGRNHNVVVATIAGWFMTNVAASARAFQYCWAAHRDECNGFPYTAALEWREAATLFASNSFFADRCWREWERIMQLPRRLAQPIGTPAVTFAYKNALKSESLTREGFYAPAA